MAVLEDSEGRLVTLGAQCLIGRAPHCRVRLVDKRVSWDHARIGWLRDGWWLRDLNSTNGTWVDGRRLSAEDRVLLVTGQRLAFGHPSLAYRVDNVEIPRFRLRSMSDERVICPTNALVGLPSDDEPRLTLSLGASGWSVEEGSQVRLLSDQEVIQFGSERWLVELPPVTDDFAETGTHREQAMVDAAHVALELRVSADRESIDVTVVVAGNSYFLPSRAHHELLLLLIEARLADTQRGVPEADAGFVTLDDAIRLAAVNVNKINLDIFRLRREFEGLGVLDPRQIIERRESRRQLRVGTGHLTVNYVRS